MNLTKLKKKLLLDLFKSNEGLFIFTLYQRYNISPKELFIAIKELTDSALISSEEDRITITKEGRKFAITSSLKNSYDTAKKNNIPEEFLGPKIGINQFYIPKIKDV